MRGVDYLLSRGDIDANRIAIAGTSQGGGIALAVAAHVPFLCDMRQAARTEGVLVKKLLNDAHLNDEAHLRTLDHFDPLRLAANLQAPALVSSGGRDTVCPPATIRSVFDRIPGVKVIRLCRTQLQRRFTR